MAQVQEAFLNAVDKEDSLPKTQQKMPLYVKVIYGAGDFSCSGSASIIGFFLIPFLYEVALVDPIVVSILLLLSHAWDGVCDPLVGRLSDLTNTRFGRRRPWIALGALPFAVSYFFIWIVFPGSSQIFDFFYYLFFLVIYNTFYSVESVPHLALVPEMTNDDKERTELVSFRLVTFVVASLFSTTVHGILIRSFEPRLGYFLSACFFSFIFIFPPIICSIFCKETAGQEKILSGTQTEQPSFLAGLKSTMKNKPFLLLCLSFVSVYLAVQLLVANFYLYVQYVLDSEDQVVFLIILIQVVLGVSILGWQMVANKFRIKKPIFYVGCCLGAICCVFLTFIRSVLWVYFGTVVLGIAFGAVFLVPYALIPEIIDLDEQKVGCRREGMFYGLFVFLQKLCTSIGLALGSFALGVAGLDAENNVAPTAALIVLRIVVGAIPAILFVFSMLPMAVYPYGKHTNRKLSVFNDKDVALDDVAAYQPPEMVIETDDKANTATNRR